MSSFLLTNEERVSPATRYPDRTQTYRGPTVVTEDSHDVTVEKDNQQKKTVVESDIKLRKRTTTPDFMKSEVRTEYEDTGTYDEISSVNYQDDRVDKKEGYFTVGNEENSFKWIDKSGVEQTDTTETTGEIKKLETKRDVKRVTSLSDVGFTNTKTNDLKDTTKDTRSGSDTNTKTNDLKDTTNDTRSGSDKNTKTNDLTVDTYRRAGTKTNTSTRNIGLRSSTTERTAGERLNTTLSTEDIGVQVSFRVEIQNRQPIALT